MSSNPPGTAASDEACEDCSHPFADHDDTGCRECSCGFRVVAMVPIGKDDDDIAW